MKKILILSVLLISTLSGCGVYPVLPPTYPVVMSSGAVYVRPTYQMPAPGYVWINNNNGGWGWHHPNHGWHKSNHNSIQPNYNHNQPNHNRYRH